MQAKNWQQLKAKSNKTEIKAQPSKISAKRLKRQICTAAKLQKTNFKKVAEQLKEMIGYLNPKANKTWLNAKGTKTKQP